MHPDSDTRFCNNDISYFPKSMSVKHLTLNKTQTMYGNDRHATLNHQVTNHARRSITLCNPHNNIPTFLVVSKWCRYNITSF